MSKSSMDLDPELVAAFVLESVEMLDDVENRLMALEKAPEDRTQVDAIFRAIHSIKGNSAYFDWVHIKLFAHNLENALDELRQGKRPVTPELIDALMKGSGLLKRLVQEAANPDSGRELHPPEQEFLQALEKMVFNVSTVEESLRRFFEQIDGLAQKYEGQDSPSGEILLGKLKAILSDQKMKSTLIAGSAPKKDVAAPGAEESAAPAAAATPAGTKDEAGAKTLRVSTEKVDEFMNYVGELIIMSDLFSNIQKSLEKWRIDSDLTTDFKQAYLSFDKLSSGLQKSLMEVRKIPAKTLLQKVPRIVRDLARQQGKEVEVQMEGTDVLLDKTLLEDMEAPLVHMARNSVDHGLETPADRKAAGKGARGILRVQAKTNQDHFVLTIQDDGRGMNPAVIRKVAVKKGLLSEAQADKLSDQEAIQLIFRPGFSTKEAVTDVSGRGVGMDVVLKNVQKCKGSVSVDSELGKGSTIAIKLPLSAILMVESGLMVKVRNDRYLIPADNVSEILSFGRGERVSEIGDAQVINVRGKLYPLVWTDQLLDYRDRRPAADSLQVVVATVAGSGCCFVVDEIVGIQQVVVREMNERYVNSELVKGVAILGHSKPVIMLNISSIIRHLSERLAATREPVAA